MKFLLVSVGPESSSQMTDYPPPPSEWLEDTLIDLYLSGNSNRETNAVGDRGMSAEMDHVDALGNDDIYELEEGEWIPDEGHNVDYASEGVSDEGFSWEEENWRAQYGQVFPSREEPHPKILAIDLWDWSLVKEEKRKRKRQVAHLVGRLVRQSTKLHPSVPSGNRLLKTAPICQVLLDLVRVRSGKVYRLKRPSAKYLASLSTYDSSNPTKDWGFPELSFDVQIQAPQGLTENSGAKVIRGAPGLTDSSHLTMVPDKNGGVAYRDRAAERRALHGGFGVGPGQKKVASGDDCEPSYPVLPEEAAGEALNMSFGIGSYARKLLENMGWKEGDSLGSSSKGLRQPLQAVGNKGNAGLGWDQNRRRHV